MSYYIYNVYIYISIKNIRDLNIKGKSINLFKDNIEKHHHGLELGKIFINQITGVLTIKESLSKYNVLKISSVHLDTIKKMKQ